MKPVLIPLISGHVFGLPKVGGLVMVGVLIPLISGHVFGLNEQVKLGLTVAVLIPLISGHVFGPAVWLYMGWALES